MLALAILDLPIGTEVLAPSLTYAATVSQALWLGHKLVLFDSDEDFQPSFDSFVDAVTKETKVLILPELYGSSPDITKFVNFCKSNGIYLIEDSAEVFGSSWNQKKLGTFGDIGSFSLFGNKTITTGEGGIVVTNSDELAEKANLLKSQAHVGGFRHSGPGFNFRMTNIQAAIGLAQMEQLSEIIVKKKRIASLYRELITSFESIAPRLEVDSTEWMPLFRIGSDTSYEMLHHLLSHDGVDSRPAFTPIHLMPGFEYEHRVSLSTAERIWSKGFNLPCYPDLTDEQIHHVITSVNLIGKNL
jgi:perosamine synthetase